MTERLPLFKRHSDTINSIAFSPDGKMLASGSSDNTIKIWNIADRLEIRTLRGHSEAVNSVAFSPDGKLLASGSSDETAKLWNIEDGSEIRTFTGHSDDNRLAFSPDGKILVSDGNPCRGNILTLNGQMLVSEDAILWNISDGKLVSLNTNKIKNLYSFNWECGWLDNCNWFPKSTFSPDAKMLAISFSGRNDLWGFIYKLDLWNISDKINVWKIDDPFFEEVNSLSFSPDSKLLASGSMDGTVRLWDVADGSDLMSLKGHSGPVWTVQFSPDGSFLASGGEDNIVRLWTLDLDELLKIGCEWLHGYLKNNPDVSEEDRVLCDDILQLSP